MHNTYPRQLNRQEFRKFAALDRFSLVAISFVMGIMAGMFIAATIIKVVR